MRHDDRPELPLVRRGRASSSPRVIKKPIDQRSQLMRAPRIEETGHGRWTYLHGHLLRPVYADGYPQWEQAVRVGPGRGVRGGAWLGCGRAAAGVWQRSATAGSVAPVMAGHLYTAGTFIRAVRAREGAKASRHLHKRPLGGGSAGGSAGRLYVSGTLVRAVWAYEGV